MTISVMIVDPHFWKAAALFNPNAFPETVRGHAATCGDRLAILTHSVEIVMNEPGLNRSRLLEQIRADPGFKGFKPQQDKPAILVFHNLHFVSGLYSALIALKSLLDLYSRLVAGLLVPKATVFGFSSGQYEGRNISGGKFLRWIERSAPTTFENREILVSVFLGHINRWVDEAVSYRDAVVHDGFIRGLREVMVPLDKTLTELNAGDLLLPMMPDGTAVTEYCDRLVAQTRTLMAETLPLLPSIDTGQLALDEA